MICALLVAGGFILGVYMPNLHNGLIAAAFTAVGCSSSSGATDSIDNTAVRVATIASVAAIVIAALRMHYRNVMGDRNTRASVTTAFIIQDRPHPEPDGD